MNWLFLYAIVSVIVGMGFALGFYLDNDEWVNETQGTRIAVCTLLWLLAAIVWPIGLVFVAYKLIAKLARKWNAEIAGD